MPLYDAIAFVKQTLDNYDLSGSINIIAAGKIITGFDILKVLALGASACYSARGMMMALGCIQALICDTDRCPVGVATQNPSLYKGLDPEVKKVRVANFHANTMEATKELMEACGFHNLAGIVPSKFFRRVNEYQVKNFEQIYFPGKQSNLQYKYSSQLN
jgi:glutamate synthase domain-containing protein 2